MTTGSARIPVILDVDTGVDDAMALALAVGLPHIDLLAVTTVAGNVDVDRAHANTRNVLYALGRSDVPVHRGAQHPLARRHRAASHVHGRDGIGGASLPESTTGQESVPGPARILALARERPGEIILIAVGPLTNLAIALNVEPRLPELLRRVVVMGGAYHVPGNITPFAEFNIWEDPEAAAQVFGAGFADLTLIGLDVTQQVNLTAAAWRALGERDDRSPSAEVVWRVGHLSFAEQGNDAFHLHDPLAVAVAADPTLVTTESNTVAVTLSGEEDGRTVPSGPGKALIARSVDTERFLAMFNGALGVPGQSGTR